MSELFPSINAIPDKLINATVYKDVDEMLGIGTLTLPDLAYVTEALEGLGIAGAIETPVAGHFQSMTVSISWNSINKQAVSLLQTRAHRLNVRASIQRYDPATGRLEPQAVKLLLAVLPKKLGLGKTEPGKKMDNETELEVTYLKLWIGGEEVVEIDKLNFICRVLGEDMLATVRLHLGKEG